MIRDWRGQPLEAGAIIVYPQRRGSRMWMVEAKVLEVTEKYEAYHDRVVPALKVQPVNATWTHTLAPKKVMLTVLDRVTVVEKVQDDAAPQEWRCSICHAFHIKAEPCWRIDD